MVILLIYSIWPISRVCSNNREAAGRHISDQLTLRMLFRLSALKRIDPPKVGRKTFIFPAFGSLAKIGVPKGSQNRSCLVMVPFLGDQSIKSFEPTCHQFLGQTVFSLPVFFWLTSFGPIWARPTRSRVSVSLSHDLNLDRCSRHLGRGNQPTPFPSKIPRGFG